MFKRLLGLAVCIAFLGLAGVVNAAEPVLLRYKLAKGDTLFYKTGQEMKQTQVINNMKIENSTTQEAVMSRVVDEIDEKGTVTFKTKAERRKVAADLGAAGKYEFDSKSTERDTTSAIGGSVTPLLERLTGSEYKVSITPRGEVTDVKGFTELTADLVKDNPIGAQFAGGGSNGAAKLAEQESLIVLSEKPVKPGDQWEVPFEVELPQLGKAKGKIVYVYEGDDKVGERKTIRIGVTTDLAVELNLNSGGAKVTGTISTSNSSGTVQFDPEAGRVISSKRNTSMSGQLSVEAGGMTFTIDNQQEQTATVALLDKLPE